MVDKAHINSVYDESVLEKDSEVRSYFFPILVLKYF